jgi:tartrate dehydrogenase/decarboxylase / D-malate dehydrogenase
LSQERGQTPRTYRIAAIPGDGIGPEVLSAARDVLDSVGRDHGFRIEWTDYDWGCERYHRAGAMMSADGLDRLADSDAIYLGAVGYPDVPDHVSLWGLLIPIRRTFAQYVNLRPIRLLRGLTSPLRGIEPGDVDFIVVRENNEGEYSEAGGRIYQGTPQEIAIQEAVFTRSGVLRAMNYAFDLAERRRPRLDSATKSNGIVHTMPFWDEIFAEVASRHGTVTTHQFHVDALAALLVLRSKDFDVIVASNLFGDILTDLAAAIVGSIGLAPSANLNPERQHPSMFEPIHGSAPDIAGRGIANPIGQIWAGAMMLDHLGEAEAAESLMNAVEEVLAQRRVRTPDLGGQSSTADVAHAVIGAHTSMGASGHGRTA